MKKFLFASMMIAFIVAIVSFKDEKSSSKTSRANESTTPPANSDYKIIYKKQDKQFENAVSDLTITVNQALQEGYKPVGGVGTLGYLGNTYIYQAVSK